MTIGRAGGLRLQLEMDTELDSELEVCNQELVSLQDSVCEDISSLLANLRGKNKQLMCRVAYLAFFSYAEATVFCLKKQILLLRKYEGWEVKGEERWFLTEKKEFATKTGLNVSRPFHIPLPKNITYTFDEYAFMHWSEYHIDTSEAGWSSFGKALSVRNRVAHPKSPQDLTITGEEAKCLKDAAEWFDNAVKGLLMHCAFSLLRYVKIFEQRFSISTERKQRL